MRKWRETAMNQERSENIRVETEKLANDKEKENNVNENVPIYQ